MRPNRKARRAQKFRMYPPVRKVGVEKGFGPRHAENAKEGDLTAVNTDTVPAMLTPREAVLNRNAAELAGRPEIEALNKKGNELAKQGVDLASTGESNVPDPKAGDRRLAGTGAQSYLARQLLEKYGGSPTAFELVPDFVKYIAQEYPQMAQKGMSNMKPKPKPSKPKPAPKPVPPPQRGGFYPPGQGMFAGGTPSVLPVGASNPEHAYGDPIQLSAGDLSKFAQAAQAAGLSPGQIAGLSKMFSGIGSGGGGNANAPGTGTLIDSGGMAYPMTGGYQGGISDIGYPPMIAPNAEWHTDGGGWRGPYDQDFMFPGYAGGESDIEPPMLRGNMDPDSWVANLPPGVTTFGGRHPGHGFINRSEYNPSAMFGWGNFMGRNQMGFQPPPWAAGFGQGPTMIPTTLGNSGYPMAVQPSGPDQNLQGVGRTHNLRSNQ